MKVIERHTVVERIHKFLIDAHQQIVIERDSMPRMLYTAMTYRLNWLHMGCAVRLGFMKRGGWHWYWLRRGKPTRKMAEELYEVYLEVSRAHRNAREDRKKSKMKIVSMKSKVA